MRLTYPDTIPFMIHLISARNVAEATEEFLELGLNVQNARVLIVALQNPGITPRWLGEITRIDKPRAHVHAQPARAIKDSSSGANSKRTGDPSQFN